MKKTILLQYLFPILLTTSILKTFFEECLFLKLKYVFWIVFACIAIIYLILINKQKKIKINSIDIIIISLSILCIFTFFKTTTVSFYHIKIWYYLGYLLIYFIGKQLICSQKDIRKTILSIIVTISFIAFINAGIAFLQYFNITPSHNRYFKINGMFHSPNQLGAILGIGILSCFAYLKHQKTTKNKQILICMFCLFLVTILLLTESRGALIALLGGSLFLNFKTIMSFIKRYNKLTFSTGLITIIITVWGINHLYHKNPDSIYGRYFILKTTTNQIIENPWGYGINSFAKEYNNAKAIYFSTERSWKEIKNADFVYIAFNDFLELFFEMGIIWFTLFLFLFFLLFYKKDTKPETTMAKSLIIFLGLFALTNTILIFPVFIITSIFCVILIQQQEFKPIIVFKNSPLINICGLIIPLFLLVIIPLRANAEIRLFNIKKNPNDSLTSSVLYPLLKKIDDSGKPYFMTAKFLNKKNQNELAIKYLDTAFTKSAMPSIGRYLTKKTLKKNNLKKTIQIFEYNKLVEPYRYQARMDLFNLYSKHKDFPNALKIAKEIIELPVKIQSKKVELYKKNAQKYIDSYTKVKTDSTLYGISPKGSSFKSKTLNKRILYYVYHPQLQKVTQKLPVLYVNDGLNYLRHGKLAKKVDSLIQHNIIEPLIIVFIEPKDLNFPKQKRSKIRQELYLCSDLYSDFLTNELFPYIERKYNTSKHRSLLGLSFGGLSAAYTAIKNPSLFKNIILQSPAFHPRKQIYTLYKNQSKQKFNIYLSYGTGKDTENQDLPFIKIIKEQNYNLDINVVPNGNHSWKNWEPQLNDILIRYFEI